MIATLAHHKIVKKQNIKFQPATWQ
jgi:hypothetical protein